MYRKVKETTKKIRKTQPKRIFFVSLTRVKGVAQRKPI